MLTLPRFFRVSLLCLATVLPACGEVGFKDRVVDSTTDPASKPDAGIPTDGASAPDPEVYCAPAISSENLPPRASVLGGRKQAAAGVFTRDLFGLFQSHCGACHVDQGLGDFKVTLKNFPEKISRDVVARVRSDDEKVFMPPRSSAGKPYSERGASDSVVQFTSLLDAWLSSGSPADVFYPTGSAGPGGKPFALPIEVGMAMTNLGNCIPAARMVGSDDEKSVALDAMFADATALPERLEETDLLSLDSEVLARHGVVAFAPGYTLWADNAKKIRMLRVPRGTSLKFDAATQSFDVPPNTRVYKTFLKRVIDYRGKESYRKMETRVIVSRPDREDGTPAALFGTYVWNEAETEAVLLRDPLRNGKPFRDRLINYITDEQGADIVLAQGPANVQDELESHGFLRTYAVPGSARCVHCHMGAPNKSFILGLTPLQLRRRPKAEGGVLEPAERDELNQLQRLIDYGVVTGMASPDEVVLLEDSQGERKPRNQHELEAQGYMLGNCAHCHNPRGFPSVSVPELRDALNFWPSKEGGIFQFPLNKVSPRSKRGAASVPMPYISPSLYDVPAKVSSDPSAAKAYVKPGCVPNDYGAASCVKYVSAPWRSLIYRNVDAPFAYAEDSVIFPHMPMDTPGYDCRARRLLGSWMVSIPTRWKYSGYQMEIAEADLPTLPGPEVSTKKVWTNLAENMPIGDEPVRAADKLTPAEGLIPADSQPYVEVLSDEAAYPLRKGDADRRVREFQAGSRYNDCPDETLNVVDPKIVRAESSVPRPTTEWPMLDSSGEPILQSSGEPVAYYSLAVPERPHWTDTDLTEAPGDWLPRRSDWADILVKRVPVTGEEERVKNQTRVIELLQSIRVEDAFKAYALSDVPFGFWQEKDGCDFSSVPRAQAFTGNQRPQWFGAQAPQDARPVYLLSPGAMVFGAICINCHGPRADSQTQTASDIAGITGGKSRVANLRDGIFGPPGMPGANVERVFKEAARGGVTSEDWAARYVLWMALGGTGVAIPPTVLANIARLGVLGVERSGYTEPPKDANMLGVARQFCENVFARPFWNFNPQTQQARTDQANVVFSNGDAEMWIQLCTLDNPRELTVVTYTRGPGDSKFQTGQVPIYRRSSYPAAALVGDPSTGGFTKGIQASNPAPWCVARPSDANASTAADKQREIEAYWSASFGAASEVPFCPPGIVEIDADVAKRWTTRGALNAGKAAFVYMRALASGRASTIPYDRCDLLPAP